MKTETIRGIWIGCLLLLATVPIRADESLTEDAPPPKSVTHKIIHYLPNRFFDLLDIFRCRVRVGPGMAADLNMTVYAANFIGQYRSVYIGLPGPRLAPILPPVVGKEKWKGLMVMGVDATDNSPYPPRYTDSECNLGAQVLLVGADVGLDPVELGDFLMGFIMKDVRGDDR